MNQAKIDILKQAAADAGAIYAAEQARLVAVGLKSQERYATLKPLKAAADAAHAAYVKYTHSQIKGELDSIIAVQTPAERQEGLRRARSI